MKIIVFKEPVVHNGACVTTLQYDVVMIDEACAAYGFIECWNKEQDKRSQHSFYNISNVLSVVWQQDEKKENAYTGELEALGS
jgi:hypothetical protein